MGEPIFELQKNTREKIVFQVGEYKGHRFIDMRVFLPGEKGSQDFPTRKGLAVPVHLYPQFKAALAEVETAVIKQGWLDREDLESQE